MNTLVEAYAWCMLQVTLFTVVAGVAYFVARRFRARHLAEFLVVSLSLVGMLTTCTLSPWPRWDIAATLPSIEQETFSAASKDVSVNEDADPITVPTQFASLESPNIEIASRSTEQIPVAVNASRSETIETPISSTRTSQAGTLFVWLA
jgi:hypothetical protein